MFKNTSLYSDNKKEFIIEPSKNIPVCEEVDICVLGGSCTGLFAAVRAARLGAKVAIVEKQNCFGGVATNSLVNIWHSLYDTLGEKQIIGGLTAEVIERLNKRKAVYHDNKSLPNYYLLNVEELKIELDELAKESKLSIYFHTLFCEPFVNNGELQAVIIEDKTGRRAIKAKVFIDATGDGDLCARLGLDYTLPDVKQPPTTCSKMYGLSNLDTKEFHRLIIEHGEEFGLEPDWGWGNELQDVPGVSFNAETHVFNVNCADADDLTYSEIEGRRQIRAYMDVVRKYGPQEAYPVLLGLSSYIGVRETRHINCLYRVTESDLLYGKTFEDAIANGSYRIDIHHESKKGITFRYLNGTEVYSMRGEPDVVSRWREDDGFATFYQVPYRSLVPKGKYKNLISCGRMIDTDKGAYGAIRVMVNLNQIGEAAGVGAYLALNSGRGLGEVNINLLRKTLSDGGSIII